ncbi:hypothetical protein KEU06_13230 [Pseudaminobacter sp. 19-2017]|uniref:Uncharacterized protein n=1 Tax=Pseudaminobacter soli (ex Zhang et al. 2022) TaxID=2831468 RepID=A0A942E6Y4_9HYPH|nr:hypothetical protein [Pseudaminobacter soli]MBS3649572.1 hypothetical protein [Pseudaminobacter soli]
MFDTALLIVLMLAAPAILAAAMIYAMISHPKLAPEERRQLHDAIDGLYD